MQPQDGQTGPRIQSKPYIILLSKSTTYFNDLKYMIFLIQDIYHAFNSELLKAAACPSSRPKIESIILHTSCTKN